MDCRESCVRPLEVSLGQREKDGVGNQEPAESGFGPITTPSRQSALDSVGQPVGSVAGWLGLPKSTLLSQRLTVARLGQPVDSVPAGPVDSVSPSRPCSVNS